jgi:hypothetical protein
MRQIKAATEKNNPAEARNARAECISRNTLRTYAAYLQNAR